LNNKNRNTKIALIVITSMIVMMGTTTLIPVLKQPQAKAASLRQHSNLLNNCFRSNTCRDSNVGQGTLGNDNSVTGFGDLSDTTTTNNASTATSGLQGPAGPSGAKGDPGAQGPAGPDKILSTREVEGPLTHSVEDFSSPTSVVAECSSDEVITGGGFKASPDDPAQPDIKPIIFENERVADTNVWRVTAINIGAQDMAIGATAECAKLVPPP
jgi:hypothetical protein